MSSAPTPEHARERRSLGPPPGAPAPWTSASGAAGDKSQGPPTRMLRYSGLGEEVELVRIRYTVWALLLATLPNSAFAQSEPISTARMSLAVGRLPSVVDMPLFFRLYRVKVPAGKLSAYDGSTAMLYNLSGTATI